MIEGLTMGLTKGSKLLTGAIVVAVNLFALLLSIALSSRMALDPFFLFVLAVALNAWYGGVAAGVLSIIFTILATDYFLLPPLYSINLLAGDVPRIAIFTIVAVVVSFLGVNRKRSEDARQRLEEIVDSSEDAIIGTTLDGIIFTWNKAAENIFDYSAHEAKGRPISFILMPGDLAVGESILERIKRGEYISPFEMVHAKKNGELADLSISVIPVRNEKGEIVGASGIIRDISQQKRTQEWLYNLSDAVENTSDVVVITDRQGVIEYVNPAFEAITGYTKEEALGKTPRLLKSDRHGRDFYQRLWDTILSGKVFHGEFTNRKKNGGLYFELKTITPIRDHQGNITHFVSTGKDVSARTLAQHTLEQRIEERTRSLATLYDVTAVASASIDLQTVLDQSLDRILTTMSGHRGEIHLLDENNDVTQFPAASRKAAACPVSASTLTADTSPVRWVATHGKPLVLPPIGNGSSISAVHEPTDSGDNVDAFAGVPIVAGRRVKGVLSINREKAKPFSADEVALLVSIGDHLGVTIEHIHLLKEAASNAARIERERLAHDLHDSVTQNIYSSTLLAEAAFRFIAAGDAPKAKHYVARLGEMAQQSLKEMRLLVYELRPLALERNNLAEALQQRLDAVEKRAGIDARLVVKGTLELPAPVEEALYRVAQEALTNSLKHAVATCVNVQLLVEDKRVEFVVEDNGKGFDPDTETDRAGLGLISMRKRVEHLGGTLSVVPRSGGGTQVSVSLPLQ